MLNSSPEILQKYKIRQQFSQDFISRSFLAENGVQNSFVEARILSSNDFEGITSPQTLNTLSAIYQEYKHQNIARFIEHGAINDGQIAFFSEYKEGYTLATIFDHFARVGKEIPIHLASFIVTEICTGLDYIHSRRTTQENPIIDSVFHGLSAENVLISRKGEIIIRGAELAPIRLNYIKQNLDTANRASFPTLAPEYFRKNATIDFRADLFAIGILFLELLMNKRFKTTFTVDDQIEYIFKRNARYFDERPEEAKDRLKSILQSILADDPGDRYSATNQLYMDLLHQLILTASNANFTDELATFIQNLKIEQEHQSPEEIVLPADNSNDVIDNAAPEIPESTAENEAMSSQSDAGETENEALAYLQNLMSRRDSRPASSSQPASETKKQPPAPEPETTGESGESPTDAEMSEIDHVDQDSGSNQSSDNINLAVAEKLPEDKSDEENESPVVDYVISDDFIDVTDLPETEQTEINIDLTEDEAETTELDVAPDTEHNFVEILDEDVAQNTPEIESAPEEDSQTATELSSEIRDDFADTKTFEKHEDSQDLAQDEIEKSPADNLDETERNQTIEARQSEAVQFNDDDTVSIDRISDASPGSSVEFTMDEAEIEDTQFENSEYILPGDTTDADEIQASTTETSGADAEAEQPAKEPLNSEAADVSAMSQGPSENIKLFETDEIPAELENEPDQSASLEYEAILGISDPGDRDASPADVFGNTPLDEHDGLMEDNANSGPPDDWQKSDEFVLPPEQDSQDHSGDKSGRKSESEDAEDAFTNPDQDKNNQQNSFTGKADKKEKEEPLFKIIDNTSNSKSASRFYSIIDDSSAQSRHTDGEEIKTIIDVVRLSARSNPKAYIFGAAMIPVLFILFTLVDTFSQFTSYGTSIYDYFFPPAIRIETIPTNAQVYLDDKPVAAKTPLQLDEIEPGVHKLKLTLPKFDSIVKSFNVLSKGQLYVAGEEERHGSVPYIFKFKVQLELSSQPPGATIFINKTRITDKTPTTVHWEIGDEPISIQMEYGNYPQIAGMTFDAQNDRESIDDKRFWRFQRLNKMKHHIAIEGVFRKEINIESLPSRAEIFVDEAAKAAGITGINGKLLFTEGEHIITLRKPGYIDRRFSLRVDDKSPVYLKETLSRYVTISSQDIESTDGLDINATIVQIAGRGKTIELNKKTPARIRLLPYTYTAVIRKANFEEQTVRISPKDKQIVAKMVPVPTDVSITAYDASTRDVVDNVTILYNTRRSLENAIILGTTNSEGKLISRVPDGYFALFARKEGYRLTLKSMRFKQGKRNRAVLWLRKQR